MNEHDERNAEDMMLADTMTWDVMKRISAISALPVIAKGVLTGYFMFLYTTYSIILDT